MADPRAAQLSGGGHGVVRSRALAHPPQHFVVAALGAVVDDAESGLAQRGQFTVILARDGARIAVDSDAAHLRQQRADQRQDLQQSVRGQHQRVAVAQEHAADGRDLSAEGRGFLQVALDHVRRLQPEALFRQTVHAAIGAVVVAAADGHLQQQALRFTGRAEDVADVIHRAAAWVRVFGATDAPKQDKDSVYDAANIGEKCLQCPGNSPK